MIICLAAGLSNAGKRPPLGRTTRAGQSADAEIKKLAYFAGKWSGEVDVKATQFGPASKFTEAAESDWMPGDHFIVMHWIVKTQAGEGTSLMILGYDSKEKRYTFNTFAGTGETASATGTVEGDTWTFYGDSIANGSTTKSRFSMKALSPSSCATKFEISPDGTTWITVMEGRISKAPSK